MSARQASAAAVLELPFGVDATRAGEPAAALPPTGAAAGLPGWRTFPQSASGRIARLFGPAPAVALPGPTRKVLADIERVREAHFARGHTPATDLAHGELFFLNGASHFLAQARHARSPEKIRQHRIEAIAMLVALIDRDDFLALATTEDADVPA